MNERIGGRIGWVVLGCLLAGGCRGPSFQSAQALRTVMRPEMTRPTVGGPHRELVVQRRQEKILSGVLRVFKDTGVEPTAAREPQEGLWLLGTSLAGRQVLIDIVPIVPGRFVVRVTVEGADRVTKDLLEDIARKLTARIG
ncbi:MAG TPA: hypothetical protein VLI39_00320 [Sedimentisphaerales bacterium]|nr:hypothetical protein [Sedimentisphaerales bacterium]